MTYDFHGTKTTKSKILPLVNFIEKEEHINWEYCGMSVELAPTVDWNNENVMIRWLDLKEGFNDKIIITSIEEFNNNFIKILG